MFLFYTLNYDLNIYVKIFSRKLDLQIVSSSQYPLWEKFAIIQSSFFGFLNRKSRQTMLNWKKSEQYISSYPNQNHGSQDEPNSFQNCFSDVRAPWPCRGILWKNLAVCECTIDWAKMELGRGDSIPKWAQYNYTKANHNSIYNITKCHRGQYQTRPSCG